MQAIASRENRIDKISGTNLYIGQYPIFTRGWKFDYTIDLTAEFLPCRKLADRYICIPNLDGIPLSNGNIPTEITKDMNVLVHCAQGHGRSATYTILNYAQFSRNNRS